MSWSKRQLIEASLEEIGIASFEFDLQSEELASGLKRLDAMMADWNARGIRVGYPLYSNPANSDITEDSQVPDYVVDTIIYNLALRLAPGYGKQASRETKVSAKNGMNTLLLRAGVMDPVEKQLPSTMPKGAGHKTHRQNAEVFFPEPTDPVDVGPDSILELN